jgi:hypothetical protein
MISTDSQPAKTPEPTTIEFNGSQIQIRDFDDAIALLQIAFDFFAITKSNQRMQAYYLKATEKHGFIIRRYYDLEQAEIIDLIQLIEGYWDADMATWRTGRNHLIPAMNLLELTDQSEPIQALHKRLTPEQQSLFQDSPLLIVESQEEADARDF